MPHRFQRESSALRLLLDHRDADDATLRAVVAQVGGTQRAIRVLFDEAYRLQVHGGSHAKILKLVAISDRIDELARHGR